MTAQRPRDLAPVLEMDAGWERMEGHMWRDGVRAMTKAGIPWPEGFCRFDLRVIAKRVLAGLLEDIPSCRAMSARWGMSQGKARRIMEDEASWVELSWAEDWEKHRADVERKWSGSRAEVEQRSSTDDARVAHESRTNRARHAASEAANAVSIEQESSGSRAEVERKSSTDRAEIERRSSGTGAQAATRARNDVITSTVTSTPTVTSTDTPTPAPDTHTTRDATPAAPQPASPPAPPVRQPAHWNYPPAFFAVFPDPSTWKPVDLATLTTASRLGCYPHETPSSLRLLAAGILSRDGEGFAITDDGASLAAEFAGGASPWAGTRREEASPPSPAPTLAAAPALAPPEPEPTPALPVEPKTDPAPPWAVKATRPKGVSALALAGAVCRIADDILGTTAPMHRRGTAAQPILALWRALGTPPLEDFERQARLVAEAARLCPDPLFARAVRAEGWQDGTDRSRSVDTLLRQDRWDERLRVAEAWAAHGRTTERAAPKVEAGPQGRPSLADMGARLRARWAAEASGVDAPPPPAPPNTIDVEATSVMES